MNRKLLHTFCHSNHSSVGAHHEHAEVGGVASHSKYGGLEVLLVSSQIDEGDDFSGGSADVNPVKATWRRNKSRNFKARASLH